MKNVFTRFFFSRIFPKLSSLLDPQLKVESHMIVNRKPSEPTEPQLDPAERRLEFTERPHGPVGLEGERLGSSVLPEWPSFLLHMWTARLPQGFSLCPSYKLGNRNHSPHSFWRTLLSKDVRILQSSPQLCLKTPGRQNSH